MKSEKMTNRAVIIGRIYEVKLEEKVTGPTSKAPGTPFIRGSIDIAVDDAALNIVPVYYTYVAPTYSSGKVNKNYNVLKGILENAKTVVTDGENATKVKVTTSIAVNDFYTDNAKTDENPDGLVSSQRFDGGFIEVTNALPEESKRLLINMDLLVNKVTSVEADAEKNIENDYVKIRGAVISYGGVLNPVNFSVKVPAGIKFFESLDLDGDPVTLKAEGTVASHVVTYQREVNEDDLGFGTPEVKATERNIREWLVTTAFKPYLEGSDNYISKEELTKMVADRNTHLAEEKKRREEYLASKDAAPAPTSGTTAAAGGFNF